MTQKDKELLLKDLCARLPYKVEVHIKGEYKTPRKVYTIYREDETITYFRGLDCIEEDIENVKPYLSPMSRVSELISAKEWSSLGGIDLIDWYNANHIDYRGLIENELALEAPEGMYKFE